VTSKPSALFTATEQGKKRFEKGDAMMRTHISRTSTTSTAIPDRAFLRRQLEGTRSAFHVVVEQLSDTDWHRKISSTAWTIGEVLTHLADTLAHTPEAIEHVRQGTAAGKSTQATGEGAAQTAQTGAQAPPKNLPVKRGRDKIRE
jgi:DinB superfamily